MTPLSDAEREHFALHGYLVREGVVAAQDCDEAARQLSARVLEVADAYADGRRDRFDFFAQMPDSLARFEAFWDLSAGGPRGQPREAWERYVVRVGHALHRDDPVFSKLCRHPEVSAVLEGLLPGPLRIVQSAVIYKQPGGATSFWPHQDAWFMPCQPARMALAFLALDDCTEENGCLEVIPGSHKDGARLRMELGASDWIPHGSPDTSLAQRPRVKLPVPRGSVIFVNGLTYHASSPNRSNGPRRALITHVIAEGVTMDPMSWVQEPAGGFAPLDPGAGATTARAEERAEEGCEEGDQFHDYILGRYAPLAPPAGRLRSVNALYETFRLAGVGDEGRRSVECLRRGLGPFRTVWGAKQRHADGAWAWEYYFYDFLREHADLSLEAVARHLAPALRVDARPPRDSPWVMFSVDCTPALLRGDGAADAHVYVDDRSYRLRGADFEFENVYSFHPPWSSTDDALARVRRTVMQSRAEAHLGRILPAELLSCGSVCVAHKRHADAVYFSRVTTAQLVAGLETLRWPAAVTGYLAARADAFAHLLWDLGFDYRCEADGRFVVEKSGFYGSF